MPTTSLPSCWRWIGPSALGLLLLFAIGSANAQSVNPDALKAEVVYRILMFVSWPPEREMAGKGLQLCTVGEGRTEAALQALSGRPIRQLTLELRRVTRPEQLASCHLLFLPTPQPSLLAALAALPILVMSDATQMLDQGAMINLQIEDGRIVFDVDLDAAKRAGLGISTKLLRLARFVRHKPAATP